MLEISPDLFDFCSVALAKFCDNDAKNIQKKYHVHLSDKQNVIDLLFYQLISQHRVADSFQLSASAASSSVFHAEKS
jgi:hypothetical protein